MPTPPPEGLNIPLWLAWIPGIAALVTLIMRIGRRPIDWLLQRASREELKDAILTLQTGRNQMMAQMARENKALLAQLEQKWDASMREMRVRRTEMHKENQDSLGELFRRLGSVEQRVAGIEGEMKGGKTK